MTGYIVYNNHLNAYVSRVENHCNAYDKDIKKAYVFQDFEEAKGIVDEIYWRTPYIAVVEELPEQRIVYRYKEGRG